MKRETERLLERAENHFYRGEYEEAMRIYALLLQDQPHMPEARIGALLSDIAEDHDGEAQALFDYYQMLKNDNNDRAEAIIEELIESIDDTLEKISELLESALLGRDESMDGISYDDFKELVRLRGSFRRAFEDIMFSTRVVITQKEELLDFIQQLVENGFNEMAMRYIEGAALAYPGEARIGELIEKIKGRT